MFGSWTTRLPELRQEFLEANPFEHVIINNFFTDEVAERLYADFPKPSSKWHHYDNPIEQKYALNDFSELTSFKETFDCLQTPEVLSLMRDVTSIDNLEADPHLHGAGLHAYPADGGKLDVHLDYSVHPVSGKERRVNLIVYLNKDWDAAWGGQLQLWDAKMEKCCELVQPAYNSAVLFRTSDVSYHGLPVPMVGPAGEFRKSIAIYYVSDVRPGAAQRLKAEFVPLPGQVLDDRMRKLYEIRKTRLITKDDLL